MASMIFSGLPTKSFGTICDFAAIWANWTSSANDWGRSTMPIAGRGVVAGETLVISFILFAPDRDCGHAVRQFGAVYNLAFL